MLKSRDKIILILYTYSLCLGLIIIMPHIFRTGHDYNNYMNLLKSNIIPDLPLSFLILKLSIIIFGNPIGIQILNLTSIFIILISLSILAYRKGNYTLLCVLPILFLGNQSIKLISGSTVRSNIAFSFIALSMLFKSSIIKDLLTISFLGITYIYGCFYFILLKISQSLRKSNIEYYTTYISITFIILLTYLYLNTINDWFYSDSIRKIGYIIYCIYNRPINIDYNFSNYWLCFIISSLSILPIIILKLFRKRDRTMFGLVIMLLLPYLPFFSIDVRWRILLTSWFPFFNLLMYIGETDIERCYMVSAVTHTFMMLSVGV